MKKRYPIFLALLSFFIINCSVKADGYTFNKEAWTNAGLNKFTLEGREGSGNEHIGCINGNCGTASKDYYKYFDHQYATDAADSNGDQGTKDAWWKNEIAGSTQEEAQSVDISTRGQNISTIYYAKAPVMSTAYRRKYIDQGRRIEKTIDGKRYAYYLYLGSINIYISASGEICPSSICGNLTEDSKAGEEIFIDTGKTILDVFHIGYQTNGGWILADSKNDKVPDNELEINEIIENWSYWKSIPGILPIAGATIENNIIKFNEDSQNAYRSAMQNGDYWGLNIKHKYQHTNVISTKFYIPYVVKIEIDTTACTVEKKENEDDYYFYDKKGSIITGNSTKEILEKFVGDCGCTAANNYWWYKKDGMSTGETDYYKKFCAEETTPKITACEPVVKDQDCDKISSDNTATKTFKIGDDISNTSCVFNVDKVDYSINDKKGSGATTYTQNYNEYCSLTCAEQIEVTLPSEVAAVFAGRYWTWDTTKNKDLIKLRGTRICNATVDLNGQSGYINDLGIGDSNINSTNPTDSYNRLYGTNGIIQSQKISTYPLLVEISDIKKTYDDLLKYKDSRENSTGGENKGLDSGYTYYYSCNCGANGCSTCSTTHYSCVKYSFESKYTGKTYTRYEKNTDRSTNGNNNSCSLDAKWDNDYEKDIDNLEELYSTIDSSIKSKTKKVNVCTETGDNGSGVTREGLNKYRDNSGKSYDFNPELKLSYYDPGYGTKYTTFKSDPKLITSEATAYGTSSFSYPTLGSSNITTLSYINSSQNQLKWVKEATFESLKYYYLSYSALPTGVLENKTSEEDYNGLSNQTYYKLGNNIYPVSLKEKAGRKKFYFEITNIGVDQKTGKSNNRFGKLVDPARTSNSKSSNSVQYTCYYNVEEDVNCKDDKCYFYRNISLNNFDPNDRESNNQLGKNWTTAKAKATLEEIDKKKEEAYSTENLQYSFHLSADNMQKIRKYNNSQSSYASGPLDKVTSVKDSKGNAINVDKPKEKDYVQSIWVESEFLTYLEKNNYASEVKLNGREKFVAWTGDTSDGTGPAWK